MREAGGKKPCQTVLIISCALAVFVLGSGFKKPPPRPPPWDTVFAAFGVQSPGGPSAPSGENSSSSRPSLHVYIDGSESMKGFVADRRSTYVQRITQLLEKVATSPYDLSIYKFATAITKHPVNRFSEIVLPQFYNGADTALTKLLTYIAEGPSDIAVVVSDLVQSEGGSEQFALLASVVGKATEKRPFIGIIAFRSSFSGTYFVETPPKKKLPLDIKEDDPQGHPFYLLVMAASEEALTQFEKYVLSGLERKTDFWSTVAPLGVQGVKFIAPVQGSSAVWGK